MVLPTTKALARSGWREESLHSGIARLWRHLGGQAGSSSESQQAGHSPRTASSATTHHPLQRCPAPSALPTLKCGGELEVWQASWQAPYFPAFPPRVCAVCEIDRKVVRGAPPSCRGVRGAGRAPGSSCSSALIVPPAPGPIVMSAALSTVGSPGDPGATWQQPPRHRSHLFSFRFR